MENFESSQCRESLAKEIMDEPDETTTDYQKTKQLKGSRKKIGPREPTESHESENAIANLPIEKIMRHLVREGKHLDQDAVYEALMEELPTDEIEIKIREDYAHGVGKLMIDMVRQSLSSDYVRLLVEPSIGTKVDELVAFAQREAQKGEMPTPMDLRRKFKESLGKKKVYRVMSLTEQELEDVKQNGFLANYYRARSTEAILQNEDGYESVGYNLANLNGRVYVHAGEFATRKNSMLISTSDFPDMAQYAAFVQLEDNWQERERAGQKLYLFPLAIDEFRNVRYGKYLPHHIKGEGTWHSDQRDIPFNDPGVESFVEFKIPPGDILLDEIKQIDRTQIPNFEFVPKEKY